MSEVVPRLWSDFDGTAVAIVRKTNPRNWSKYPLLGVDGYADFLRGVQSAGVDVAGVVSRRPDILVRRMATARSITKLGYAEFFTIPEQIVHKGSEEAKGKFVAEQSCLATIGMLEDKPHKLGSVLLEALTGPMLPTQVPHHPIVLGVVAHDSSQKYIERLAEMVETTKNGGLVVNETGPSPMAPIGLSIRGESVLLDVVQLEPYSKNAGAEFGHRLLEAAI